VGEKCSEVTALKEKLAKLESSNLDLVSHHSNLGQNLQAELEVSRRRLQDSETKKTALKEELSSSRNRDEDSPNS
jgi:hypothetical protein